MTYLLFGFGFLILLYAILQWAASANPKAILGSAKWVILTIALLIGLLVVATGRWGLIWMVLAGALPFISRFNNFKTILNSMRGPSPGNRSDIRTEMLAMTLDHDTGRMEGEVLVGRFKGLPLSSLPLSDLLNLLAEAERRDPKSVPLLETFLDREHPEWRDETDRGEERPRGDGGGAMTREEALQILGLEEGADKDAIRDAHRRLMKHAHPDAGGSDYLAAKINQAKDLLLNAT